MNYHKGKGVMVAIHTLRQVCAVAVFIVELLLLR